MRFTNTFSQTSDSTRLQVIVNFDSEADMERIIGMGFKEVLPLLMVILMSYWQSFKLLDPARSRPTKSRGRIATATFSLLERSFQKL